MNRLLLVFAGLLGVGGVAAAAAAAHVTGGGPLASAAEVAMVHAAALVGLAALAGRTTQGAGPLRAIGVAIGLAAGLFAADVSLLVFAGRHLFPYAAPIGGTTLIVAWAALAVLAGIGRIGGSGRA